jgi:hypothetical protein
MDSPSIRERSYCLDLDKSARFANNDSDGGAAVCMHQIGAVLHPGVHHNGGGGCLIERRCGRQNTHRLLDQEVRAQTQLPLPESENGVVGSAT